MAETQETRETPAAAGRNPFIVPVLIVFLFFLVFILISLFYEVFIYKKYLDLYKNQTIHVLAFGMRQAGLKSANDQERLGLYNTFAEQVLRDPNVQEIWVTDKDLRLLYSSNPDTMKNFQFQKLSAFYFPLYQDGFSLSPGGFEPVVRHNLDRFSDYAVLPVKVSSDSFYDITVGLKIRKINFLFNRGEIAIGPVRADLSVAVVWTLMVLLAAVFTLIIANLFVPIYGKLRDHVRRLNAGPDRQEGSAGDPPALIAPILDEIKSAYEKVRAESRQAAGDSAQGALRGRDEEIRKTVVDSIFTPSGDGVKGLDRAFYFSRPSAKAKNLLLVRGTGSFQEEFCVAQPADEKVEPYLVAASRVLAMFNGVVKGAVPRDVLCDMNADFADSYLAPANVLVGRLDLASNILSLMSAGFNTFLFHNRKIDEFMVFPAGGLPAGKSPNDEFSIGLKEAKLKMSSGDAVLFFNQAVLSRLPLEQLKKLMSENAGLTASSILEAIKKTFSDPAQEEIFLFLVKKS